METFKVVCTGMEERYLMNFETIGFDEDHVHFMLKSLPRYSPSQLFRVVKSVTAIQLLRGILNLRKNCGEESFGATAVTLEPSARE